MNRNHSRIMLTSVLFSPFLMAYVLVEEDEEIASTLLVVYILVEEDEEIASTLLVVYVLVEEDEEVASQVGTVKMTKAYRR